jgi:hypothetical protein
MYLNLPVAKQFKDILPRAWGSAPPRTTERVRAPRLRQAPAHGLVWLGRICLHLEAQQGRRGGRPGQDLRPLLNGKRLDAILAKSSTMATNISASSVQAEHRFRIRSSAIHAGTPSDVSPINWKHCMSRRRLLMASNVAMVASGTLLLFDQFVATTASASATPMPNQAGRPSDVQTLLQVTLAGHGQSLHDFGLRGAWVVTQIVKDVVDSALLTSSGVTHGWAPFLRTELLEPLSWVELHRLP